MVRDRTTLSLGELAPASRAEAASRGLTLAALVRVALSRMLDSARVGPREPELVGPDERGRAWVKVTVRMPKRAVHAMAVRAEQRAVSHGAYLGALVTGSASLPSIDLADAVAGLRDSTDRLAAVSSDLNELTRRLQGSNSGAPDTRVSDLADLSAAIRLHLVAAAEALEHLQPIADWRRRALDRRDTAQRA